MIFSLLNSSQGFSIPGADPSPVLAKGFTHRKHKAGTELCQHCRSLWPLEHRHHFGLLKLESFKSLPQPQPKPKLKYSQGMSEIPEDILSSLQELLSRAARVPNPQHLTDPAWREFPLHPRGDGP